MVTEQGICLLLIEAIMGLWEDDGDPDNRMPFAETRNCEERGA